MNDKEEMQLKIEGVRMLASELRERYSVDINERGIIELDRAVDKTIEDIKKQYTFSLVEIAAIFGCYSRGK